MAMTIDVEDLGGSPAVGTWPRLFWPDVIAWVRASRVRSTPHAEARLQEVLEREASE